MPRLRVDDCNLFYEDIGWDDPVLFLHSAYSRGVIAFSGQIQPFFHHWRCLLPDLRGHGRTTAESPDWDTPRIAADMAGFLDGLGVSRVHVVGYSLGAGVGLHLAAAHPERVRSLILIGTGGVADPEGADDYEPEALVASGQTGFIERIRSLHAEAHGGDWAHHLRQNARDWRRYPSLTDAEAARIAMPMLLIGGERDPYASPDKLRAMQTRYPQAEVWVVPGAGHGPHFPTEQCREVNERMMSFLQTQG